MKRASLVTLRRCRSRRRRRWWCACAPNVVQCRGARTTPLPRRPLGRRECLPYRLARVSVRPPALYNTRIYTTTTTIIIIIIIIITTVVDVQARGAVSLPRARGRSRHTMVRSA